MSVLWLAFLLAVSKSISLNHLHHHYWKHFFFTYIFVYFYLFIFIFFYFFRAAPEAYGDSQARGGIRATAAGLHHPHSNAKSEPHLQPTPQLTATPILNPLHEARDRTHVLMDASWVR